MQTIARNSESPKKGATKLINIFCSVVAFILSLQLYFMYQVNPAKQLICKSRFNPTNIDKISFTITDFGFHTCITFAG